MKDFSSDIVKAQSFGAQLIGPATPSPQISNIVKQAAEFGINQASQQRLAPIGLFSNDIKGLGLQTAQGLRLTESFYWDQDDAIRAFSRRFFDRDKRMPNSLQASVYGPVKHYLNAVKAAGTDETAAMVKMKATPINDFMTRNGPIRADGRVLRDVGVFRVKTPAQSSGEWDLLTQIATTPGQEAFSAPDPACSLVR